MTKSWWVHLTVLAQLDSCNVAHDCLVSYLTDAQLAMQVFMDGGYVVQERRSLPHWISSEWALESITALVEGAHLHTGQVFQRVHAFSPPGRRTSRVLMQKEAVMVVLELTSHHCNIQERFCICQSLAVHASVHAPLFIPTRWLKYVQGGLTTTQSGLSAWRYAHTVARPLTSLKSTPCSKSKDSPG